MNSNELERFEEKVHVALRRVNSVLVDEQNSFLDGTVSRSVLRDPLLIFLVISAG
jgi:hypothetical protein